MPIKGSTFVKPKIPVKKPRGFSVRKIEVDVTKCPYCGGKAELHLDSKFIYKINYGPVYACENYPKCDSYVGTVEAEAPSKIVYRPIGTLASKPLRALRKRLRTLLEEVVSLNTRLNIRQPKDATYTWLASELYVEVEKCKISYFTMEIATEAYHIVCNFIKENFEAEKADHLLSPPDLITTRTAKSW